MSNQNQTEEKTGEIQIASQAEANKVDLPIQTPSPNVRKKEKPIGDRQPLLVTVFARMGIGKTYKTKELANQYYKSLQRPVIVFDPNDSDSYSDFYAVDFDIEDIMRSLREYEKSGKQRLTNSEKNIKQLKRAKLYRICPLLKNGQTMNLTQKKQTLLTILKHFEDGLIIIEDPNEYMTNWQREEVQSAFKAIRHKGQDIILHLQSVNAIPPILFEATTIYRIHYSEIDVSKNEIRKRIPAAHFELIKIAQLIVEHIFLQHTNFDLNSKHKREREMYHAYRSYSVTVHTTHRKIFNITEDQYRLAADKYITAHKEVIRPLAMEIANQNQRVNPVFQDWEKARYDWIEAHVDYVGGD